MKKEEGSALVLAMSMIVILLLLVTATMHLINNELSILRYEENNIKTQYFAEAVVEYASKHLVNDDMWNDDNELDLDDNFLDSLLSGARISRVKKQAVSSDEQKLDVKVGYGGIDKEIESIFNIKKLTASVYDKAMATCGDIIFNGEEEGEVDGDIYTTGDIQDIHDEETSKMELSGEVEEGQEECIIPSFQSFFDNINDYSNLIYDQNSSNNIDFNDFGSNIIRKIIGNNVLFDYPLTINGPGILVVNGGITFKAPVSINVGSDDFFIIIANGPVIFTNTSQVTGNFLLYNTADVQFHCEVDMNGSIIAKDKVHADRPNFNITHDNSYLDTFIEAGVDIPGSEDHGDGGYELRIIEWRES